MGPFRKFLTLLPALVLPVCLSAQPAEPVAGVLLTRGDVMAIDGSGASRTINRRAELFSGERVVTGPDGFAQIRMVDSAIIALGENTEFELTDYTFDGEGGNPDSAVMTLVRGKFRTITGIIGTGDEDEYRMDTAAATLGNGGGTFECAIQAGKLFCGVYSGSITMTNAQGSVVLGLGGNHDFAEAEFAPRPITPLNVMPPALGNTALQANPNTLSRAAPSPNTVTPLSNTISFPAPAPIRVVPYRNQTP